MLLLQQTRPQLSHLAGPAGGRRSPIALRPHESDAGATHWLPSLRAAGRRHLQPAAGASTRRFTTIGCEAIFMPT
jgi:hypothetical protein